MPLIVSSDLAAEPLSADSVINTQGKRLTAADSVVPGTEWVS